MISTIFGLLGMTICAALVMNIRFNDYKGANDDKVKIDFQEEVK